MMIIEPLLMTDLADVVTVTMLFVRDMVEMIAELEPSVEGPLDVLPIELGALNPPPKLCATTI
jgi:hypothetical protein